MKFIKLSLCFLVFIYLSNCDQNNLDKKKISGKDIYFNNCHSCHQSSEKAPDLTSYRIDLSQMIIQIKYGGGGMPAFNKILSEKEIIDVANYILNKL